VEAGPKRQSGWKTARHADSRRRCRKLPSLLRHWISRRRAPVRPLHHHSNVRYFNSDRLADHIKCETKLFAFNPVTIFNNFKQNDCQRFTEFRFLAFVLLSTCYSHTKIAALGGEAVKHSVVALLALSTVATTTVAQGAPELVVFVQTAFGNEEGGMSC
jgi:hypothetical protein